MTTQKHMGGCRNYLPFWGSLNIRCRIIIGYQKATIILTTTHILFPKSSEDFRNPPPHRLYGTRVMMYDVYRVLSRGWGYLKPRFMEMWVAILGPSDTQGCGFKNPHWGYKGSLSRDSHVVADGLSLMKARH